MHLFIHRPESCRRRTAQAKVSITVFHRVDRGRELGETLSQAVICQVFRRNMAGGASINTRSSLGRVVHTSAAGREASAQAPRHPCTVIPAFANISRKAVKLEGGRRSGATTSAAI